MGSARVAIRTRLGLGSGIQIDKADVAELDCRYLAISEAWISMGPVRPSSGLIEHRSLMKPVRDKKFEED
jgi:hypothetical protein